jgi:hypothetical protein
MLVVDPVAAVALETGELDVAMRPEEWILRFAEGALFLSSLRNWIAEGYIDLIVPPRHWSRAALRRLQRLLASRDSKSYQDRVKRLIESDDPDFHADVLLGRDEEFINSALAALELEKPGIHARVVERLQSYGSVPSWFAIPEPTGHHAQIVTREAFVGPPELEYLIDNWAVHLSTSRSELLVREAFGVTLSQDVALDRLVRSLPLEFPSDVPLDLLYRFRQEGRLQSLRQYLSREFDLFAERGAEDPEQAMQDLAAHVEQALQDHRDEWEDLKHVSTTEVAATGSPLPGATTAFVMGEMHLLTFVLIVSGAVSVPLLVRGAKAFGLQRQPLYALHTVYQPERRT